MNDLTEDKKIFLKITEIFATVLLGLILLPFVLYVVFTVTPGYDALIVRSGSMEPDIPTESVVYTGPVSDYSSLTSGDVITFEDEEFLVTHRIQEVSQQNGEYFFITKGDANEDIDPEPVSQNRIRGKVLFNVPYFGFLVNYLDSVPGIILLVLIPALLIIWWEIGNISSNLKQVIRID